MKITKKIMRKVLLFHVMLILFSGVFNVAVNLINIQSFILEILSYVELIFCIAMGLSMKNIRRTRSSANFIVFLLLIMASVFSFIINRYSPLLYLNGLRSAFKYFIFFFNCVILLEREDVMKMLDFGYLLIIGNAIACTGEFFVLGFRGDECCGLFGTAKLNSYLNILILFMSSYAIAAYLQNVITLKKMAVIVVLSLYICALSELKFFFFEFGFVAFLNMIYYKPNKKTITMASLGIAAIIVLPMFITQLWGDTNASGNYFSIEGIMEYIDTSTTKYGYASKDDLGRIGGISKLNEKMFSRTTNVFGLGLGYCDYGSPFLNVYEYLHYIWFTYILTYLELGWVGFFLYIIFLLLPIYHTLKAKSHTADPQLLSILSMVFACAPVTVILLFYNTTLRNVPAYLMFFFISFAYIIYKKPPKPRTLPPTPQNAASSRAE